MEAERPAFAERFSHGRQNADAARRCARIGEVGASDGLTLLCRVHNLTWRFIGAVLQIEKELTAAAKR